MRLVPESGSAGSAGRPVAGSARRWAVIRTESRRPPSPSPTGSSASTARLWWCCRGAATRAPRGDDMTATAIRTGRRPLWSAWVRLHPREAWRRIAHGLAERRLAVERGTDYLRAAGALSAGELCALPDGQRPPVRLLQDP